MRSYFTTQCVHIILSCHYLISQGFLGKLSIKRIIQFDQTLSLWRESLAHARLLNEANKVYTKKLF